MGVGGLVGDFGYRSLRYRRFRLAPARLPPPRARPRHAQPRRLRTASGASCTAPPRSASAIAAAGISGAAGGPQQRRTLPQPARGCRRANSASRPSIAAKAAPSAAFASSEEICSAACSMTATCESIRSQIRPSLPISRNRQAISRSTRAPLRTARLPSVPARARRAPRSRRPARPRPRRGWRRAPRPVCCWRLRPRRGRSGHAAATAFRGSRRQLAFCCRLGKAFLLAARLSCCAARLSRCAARVSSFWAARLCSIRATASSTMRVSALRLRLAYSVRNQRPREVSMKASLIAA